MSNSVRWGLVGASRIAAEWVIPAIRETTGAEVISVQGGDIKRVAAYAAEHDIPNCFSDIDDLLTSNVDAVYISNTNEKHFPDTIKALKAGKHVLCEKPMAMTLQQAEEMLRLARERKLILGVNHHLSAMNSHRKIRELVEGGVIGDLVSVRIMFGVRLPESSMGWRTESAASGAGVFYDLTVHNASILHFILGEKITKIFAMSSNTGVSAKGIEDTVAAVATTESGLLINITESFNIDYAETSIELHGTSGSVFATGVLLQRAGGEIYVQDKGGRKKIPLEHVNAYPRVISAFSGAVKEGTPLITNAAQGFYALSVAVAAQKSITENRVVVIESFE